MNGQIRLYARISGLTRRLNRLPNPPTVASRTAAIVSWLALSSVLPQLEPIGRSGNEQET